ncbi:Hypothetical predicted protein [Cloeon dipterum]|uniref:SXP/RAL-2 family protein Ani s 5-like cation-binding domain-containing protein n=1 Tax=Cloeon dipterum TaxID=197152 RepID=A0A8S1D3I1_9INSE|nr:Hypothetical predicted protein [Cloeon dipterum]CAB3388596.1 Hypothetical predicted protein [Cloeon dipterum]
MRAVLVVFASLFFALAAQGERPDVPFSVAERIRQLSDQRLMRDLLRTSRTPVTAAAAPSTEFRAQHPDARPRRRRTMTELLAWEIHRFSQRILEGMDELSRDVNRELQQVEKNLQALHVAQQRLPGQLRFGLRLDRMVTAVHEVDAMFRKMSSLMKGSGWSEHTLRRFAQDVLSHGPGSLSEQLQVMHHDLLDTVETHGREGILQLVLRAVQVHFKWNDTAGLFYMES